jgi:translation initiation factor 1
MSKKKSTGGIVFSTDPGFKRDEEPVWHTETLPPVQQKLRVRLDTKQRAGKSVTLIQDFVGMQDDLEDLGKKLKTFCGTGGSVKDGEIIVQGDNRDKVVGWLIKNGYQKTKKI